MHACNTFSTLNSEPRRLRGDRRFYRQFSPAHFLPPFFASATFVTVESYVGELQVIRATEKREEVAARAGREKRCSGSRVTSIAGPCARARACPATRITS